MEILIPAVQFSRLISSKKFSHTMSSGVPKKKEMVGFTITFPSSPKGKVTNDTQGKYGGTSPWLCFPHWSVSPVSWNDCHWDPNIKNPRTAKGKESRKHLFLLRHSGCYFLIRPGFVNGRFPKDISASLTSLVLPSDCKFLPAQFPLLCSSLSFSRRLPAWYLMNIWLNNTFTCDFYFNFLGAS